MSDLAILQMIEKQIDQPLRLGDFSLVMNWTARCSYALNEQQQIIGLNLRNCDFTNISLLENLTHLQKLNLGQSNYRNNRSKKLNGINTTKFRL